jgi:hypothetical protein
MPGLTQPMRRSDMYFDWNDFIRVKLVCKRNQEFLIEINSAQFSQKDPYTPMDGCNKLLL